MKKIKLSDIGKISMCKRVLKSQTSEAYEIPFYKISTFGRKADTFISRKLFEEYKEKFSFPNKGDVLISAAGTLGKTVIYDGEEAFFQDSNIVWVANDETTVINEYLYYYYKTNPWKVSEGSTIKRLYNNDLGNLEINIPDISNQKLIAGVLSTLDDKIALNRKINTELEQMAREIYDYWFLQFDFPDESGQPYRSSGGRMVYNAQLKREIPEGWEVKKVDEILEAVSDNTKKIEAKEILKDGIFPVITQDKGEVIKGYTNAQEPIRNFPVLVFGDHSTTLRYINFPFFRGADGTQLLYFSNNEITRFVYLWLNKFLPQIPNYGKYERHFKYLKDMNILLPKDQVLDGFDKIIKPIFQKIQTNNQESRELAQLRDWVLPVLMNGQVQVKD